MRRHRLPHFHRLLRAVSVAAALLASSADAAVLPFTGNFQVEIGSIVTAFPVSGSATVNGSGGGEQLVSL